MMSLKKMFITVVAVAGAITAVNAEQPVNKNVDASVTTQAPVTQVAEQKKQEPVTQAPVTTEAPKQQEAAMSNNDEQEKQQSAEEFQEFLKTLETEANKKQGQ